MSRKSNNQIKVWSGGGLILQREWGNVNIFPVYWEKDRYRVSESLHRSRLICKVASIFRTGKNMKCRHDIFAFVIEN